MNAIEVKNLSFGYSRSTIIENTSFSIPEGDLLALIGPNGGGKTTLLKLLLGLLKPETGTVLIFGENVPCRKIPVGYVPQNTNANLEFPITVTQCVATGFVKGKVVSSELKLLLEKVGIQDFADKRLGELSGGERQKVLIARALACKPKILFLDEPSSNMDAQGQENLFKLLATLNQDMTIVLVSHDLMAISKYVKSVLCVNRCVHYHPGNGLTGESLHEAYGCEIDLIAHGVVGHRVLSHHDHSHCHSKH